jgi:glycosyltransferase involved in cell wall biosynthesis
MTALTAPPLRVGYLAALDPAGPWAWSGTHPSMLASLRRAGAEVVHIGRSYVTSRSPLARAGRALQRLLGLGGLYETFEPERFRDAVDRDLSETPCDVLFAPVASSQVAAIRDGPPIVTLSDATLRLLRSGHGHFFLEQSATDLEQLEQDERTAIRRASRLVYPSDWAIESAVRDYGADPRCVHRVEFGANLADPPSAEVALERDASGECRLLFIGRNWEWKGGPIARAALVALLEAGIPARLTVIGAPVPAADRHPALEDLGLLDKSVPQQRARLVRAFLDAHFLLFPTRADCFGIVVAEASAYGVPTFAARVGGVPAAVRDGENGFVLPRDASGADYATAIARVFRDPAAYRALARSSRATYEALLNWDVWGQRVFAILREASDERIRGADPLPAAS